MATFKSVGRKIDKAVNAKQKYQWYEGQKYVSTSIGQYQGAARKTVAAQAFAREGYEKFSLSKGGTYQEYYRGAQFLLKGDNKLTSKYYEEWREQARRDIMAYNNVVSELGIAIDTQLSLISESKRYLIPHFQDAWNMLRDKLMDIDQSTAAKAGRYYREKDHYKKLERLIFDSIFASEVAEIERKSKAGSRSIENLLKAFSRSTGDDKATAGILKAIADYEKALNDFVEDEI